MPHLEDDSFNGAQQLDEKKLVAIYDAFSPALFRYAYRLLGDTEAAEDIVAETFFRFLRSLKAGGGPNEHLKAYLYRVAHNLIVDRFRRHPPIELSLDYENVQLSDANNDPVHKAEMTHAQAKARQALWKLTPEQRQVIVLKFFEGLNNEEVSLILKKPVGAVKSLQHRGLNALRRVLVGEEV